MPDDTPARFADDAAASSRAGGTRHADWRTEEPGAAGNRTVLAVLTLLLLLAIAGVLIGIFVFWLGAKPVPRLVSVPIGQYRDPAWPVNPWSEQDAELLAGCFPDHSEIQRDAQQQDKLRALLGQLAVRDDMDKASQPLVLHITALAIIRDSQLYLLPADARPDNPTSWMPVEELLDAFDKAAARNGKLLVLDLAHPTADPFSGLLRDVVSNRLHEILEARASTLSYPMLTPCGPGEESLPADSEHCSGFAFYLARGLRGAADGYLGEKLDKSRDEEVTLPELAEFLSGRVSRWARLVHDRNQTPRLYGPTGGGPVFRVSSSSPTQAAEPTPPDPYPQWLVDGWQYRAEQQKVEADRKLRVPFARLTAALLRAEQEWLRSGDTARAERNWQAACGTWQKTLTDSGGPNPSDDKFAQALDVVGRYRLAVARRNRPPVPADWVPALDPYLTAKVAVVPGKPDESGKYREEWLKKATPEKGPENRLDATGLLWDRFQLSPPSPPRASAWVEALNDLKGDREYSETLLIRSFNKWEPFKQVLAQYPQDQAAELVRAEAELSHTLALGPDGFDLVRGKLDQAREAYLTGTKNLFTGKYEEVRLSLSQLKDATSGFRGAGEELTRWQAANRTLEAAAATLLDTMPTAMTAPRPEFEAWVKGVRAATALADELAPIGRERSLNLARLAETTNEVNRTMPFVKDLFAIPPGKKEPDPLPPRLNPADVQPYLRLLAGTALPAESRRRAWDTVQADYRKFQEAACGQDAADDDANDPTANPTPAAEKGRIGEAELAIRRAKVSVELLKLCGSANAPKLDALVDRMTPDASAEVEPLGQLLHRAWMEELPEQVRTALDAKRWHEARRIARMTPPGAAVLRSPVKDFAATSPADREVVAMYRQWVREQLLADQPLRPKATGAAEFYEAIRQDLELGPD